MICHWGTGTSKQFMGVGRNLQVNAFHRMSAEKYTKHCWLSLCSVLSQQSCTKVFCLIATCAFSPWNSTCCLIACSKWHGDECSCHLVVGSFVKDQFWWQLWYGSYHNNLAPPASHPLLISSAVARLNGQNGRYIDACFRRCEEPFLLLHCHRHYFTLHHSTLLSPWACWGDRS